MEYTVCYDSPLGELLLAADGERLTGLWFVGAKYFAQGLSADRAEAECPVLEDTRRWLDIYFSGRQPDFMPPLGMRGTAFQLSVWELLREIPYGKTVSYGEIARRLEACRGTEPVSAQAVGGAVGHNRISIIVPCHRVVGSDGTLTGYAGGLDKKSALLRLEGADIAKLYQQY